MLTFWEVGFLNFLCIHLCVFPVRRQPCIIHIYRKDESVPALEVI